MYASKQVTDNAYELVSNAVIFVADCWEWNQWTADNKTLPDLKTFFTDVHREWHLSLQNKTGTS